MTFKVHPHVPIWVVVNNHPQLMNIEQHIHNDFRSPLSFLSKGRMDISHKKLFWPGRITHYNNKAKEYKIKVVDPNGVFAGNDEFAIKMSQFKKTFRYFNPYKETGNIQNPLKSRWKGLGDAWDEQDYYYSSEWKEHFDQFDEVRKFLVRYHPHHGKKTKDYCIWISLDLHGFDVDSACTFLSKRITKAIIHQHQREKQKKQQNATTNNNPKKNENITIKQEHNPTTPLNGSSNLNSSKKLTDFQVKIEEISSDEEEEHQLQVTSQEVVLLHENRKRKRDSSTISPQNPMFYSSINNHFETRSEENRIQKSKDSFPHQFRIKHIDPDPIQEPGPIRKRRVL